MKIHSTLTAAALGVALLATGTAARTSFAESHATSSAFSQSSSSKWNWSASSGGRHGTAGTTVDSHVELTNVPVLQAISIVEQAGRTPTLLSEAAAKLIRKSDKIKTIATNEGRQIDLLRRVLEGLPLKVRKGKTGLEVLARAESASEVKLTPLSEVAVEAALEEPLTLNLDFVPAPMALEMIEGFSGVAITYEGESRRWPLNGPLVSIHAAGTPTAEVLQDVAKQGGLQVQINGKSLELLLPAR
jgi:hypothetical protein